MNIFKRICVIVSLLLCCSAAWSQSITNKGKEFWVGYGHHQFMEPACNGNTAAANNQNMVLYLSAEEPAVVTVTIDSSGPFPATWFRRTYNIPANTVISTENLPKGTVNATASASDPNFDARLYTDPPPAGTGGEGIFRKKGIHIESNVPIVAYAHIYGQVSSAATMLLPITAWGYQYTSLNSEQRDASQSYSWLYVIAKEDNTKIEIVPITTSRLGKPANTPFQVVLMKGQIYQLIAPSDCASGNGPELTGSTIKSIVGPDGKCHQIAVFSGSSRTGGETLTCGTGSGRDNDMQQNFPEQTWGRRYLTAPFSKATGSTVLANQFQTSVYKVVVRDPTTVVKRNGVQLTGLISNRYYKYSSITADYIEADKPVLVGQFMSGTTTCNGGQGDPEMVYLSPIEQAIKKVGFYRNTKEAITVNYVTLIVPTPGVPSLRIDNSSTFSHTYPHPNLPGYTVVIKGWPASQSQCLMQCDSGFNATTYGLGGAESYAYNAGTFLNNLNAVSAIHNEPDTSNGGQNIHIYNCVNTPVNISALLRYQPTQLVFKMSGLGSAVTPNNDFPMNPASNYQAGTVVINNITYYKYTIPGTYRFNTPGTHYITLLATSPVIENCNNTEELQISIEVKAKPLVDFSITHSGCAKDTVLFLGPVASNNSYTIGQWQWALPGPDTVRTQNAKKIYSAGTYNASLYVATTEGCASDTTKPFTVFAPPVATFGTTPQTVCLGQPITLSDTSSYAGPTPINNWYWDLGNGTIYNNPNNANVVVNYSTPGFYTVKHVVRATTLCTSDTVSKVVHVSPKAVVAITYPSGCVPASGVAQFTAASTDLGGQAITSYNWNFGDPGSGANNTSTAQNPTHTYSAYGNYTVTLSVTTSTGCTGDTSFVIAMNIRPTTTYGAINPVCQNSAPVSVANGSVTNGVPGSGVYSGPGTTSAGMFDPAVAGYGVHTIKYIFTSNAGCTDTSSQTVTVYAKPLASFTYPTGGCLPSDGLVQFTNTSTIPDAQGITYSWNFGDPASGANNTSTATNPTHNFTDGTYTIKLTATSSNGCIDDTTITTTFRITPVLNYPALNSTCASTSGTISVATATVTNGVAGTGVYSGPGTDPAGNFNPSNAGPGVHTIRYIFTSNGGCKDTADQTIRVWAKPASSFNYSTQGCLSTNGTVQFTANSTVSDGQTLSYSWDFGDPASGANNTSTSATPSHTYTEGSYLVKLTTNTTNGCIGDTIINVAVTIKPDVNYPALTNGCEGGTGTISVATATVLNGVAGTGVYSGPGTDAAGNFDPNIAGAGTHTITYIFTSNGGCTDTATQTIRVYAKPFASFTYPAGGCLQSNGLVQFGNSSTISDGYSLNYSWNFGDPGSGANNTSTLPNPTHTYAEGTYTIKLTVTSANGCIDDTSITATFSIKPDATYPALNPVCESVTGTISVATATITNGVAGTGVYNGVGTDASGNFSPSTAGAGLHTITYIFTSAGGCKDTATQTIRVYAKPLSSFTYPAGGCLPTTGLVQFTNASTISDGSTLSYSWDFGDPASGANNTSTAANPTHTYPDGTYTIKLTTTSANGCVDDTLITATFSIKPDVVYGALNNVCASVTGTVSVANASVTNAVPGTGVYSGPGTDASGNFSPSVAGAGTHTITYIFTSPAGCKDTATQTILVYAKPLSKFTFTSSGCNSTTGVVQFTNTSTITDGQTMSYSWNFGDPASGANNTSTATSPSHTFTEGTYQVKLSVTTANGCVHDTTIQVAVTIKPDITYPALTTICESTVGTVSVATATVTNVTGSGVYSGPGTDAAGNFNPSVAGPGTHTITYIFTSTGGCKDTATQTIGVYPKPFASFSYPTGGCIPSNGFVQFVNSSTVSNGSTLSYAWDFGDANANAGNPNTSNAQNPSHNYLDGTYTIKLTVTSSNGCVDDTTITATFSVKPDVIYPALPAYCQSLNGTVSIASGAVTNSVPGSGVYSGPGTDAAGNFSPSAAGAGTHTITFIYTSTGGCKDTATSTVKVNPKPVAAFTATSGACLGQDVTISNTSTISSGNITNYIFLLGDGATVTRTNNASFTYAYTAAGTYTIKMVATSDSSCTSDTTTQVVNIRPLPTADFTLPAGVCMPNGVATFTNTSTVADGSALTYVWDYGDGSATSTSTNGSHVYASNAPVTVKLTATSAFGCTQQVSKSFSAFFDKPIANFDVTPSSLCQGENNTFIDLSTAPNSTITEWNWNFDDNSPINTAQNPTKRYSKPGVYNISLVVKNPFGCVSDTFRKSVTVNLQPKVDAGESFIVAQGTPIQFNATSNNNGTLTFTWSPATDLSSSSVLRPTMIATRDQMYTLTATGPGNCTATDFLTVKILKPLKIPNAFSPNGDNINDTWEIPNLADYPKATVEVFNRYGQRVFRSINYARPWDGTFNGAPLPLATYYYIIDLNDGSKPLNGSVTIVR